MKNLAAILITFFMVFSFAACSSEETESKGEASKSASAQEAGVEQFEKDTLFYNCNAKTIDDVKNFTIMSSESGLYFAVTEKEDIELFSHYKYSEEYPMEELHVIFAWPNYQRFELKVKDMTYHLYLGEDGSITVNNTAGDKFETYTAADEYKITPEKFKKLEEKYEN